MTLKTVGIFANPRKARLAGIMDPFLPWLAGRGIRAAFTEEQFSLLRPDAPNVFAVPEASFGKVCDLVVAMGGDGTMLNAARLIGSAEKPLFGVNLGSLGFLAEVPAEELLPRMEAVLSGKFRIEKRMALETTTGEAEAGAGVVTAPDGSRRVFRALNDVVIDRGGSPRIIRIQVEVDGRPFHTIRADGVIAATPTGSTAYSLSASGPIVVPTLDSIILSPICPHSLSARPTVLEGTSTVRLRVESAAKLSIDGQIHTDVPDDATVVIRRAPEPVHWLTFEDHDFFDLLRRKLHWGVPPRK
ncbi:NAD(+)/NADH kinase [bacterium]|nr:NAD(+)/NADH kinase [bacterium]